MAGEARPLSIAFVLPYGEPSEGFFPDALLEHVCALARDRGHDARLVRVYYDGRDSARDTEVRERLVRWLDERNADVVVVERLFDAKPIRDHVARAPHRRAVMMSWGDGDAIEGIDLIVGRRPGLVRGGTTRRSPSAGELAHAFVEVIDAIARGDDPSGFGETKPAKLARPFRAALDHDVIAPGPTPSITRKYLFGNAGCPFALDPMENATFARVELPNDAQIARLGCAFCHAGGDYQKRADEELVDELLDQAKHYLDHAPGVSELVLVDQHAIRILAPLIREATKRSFRPVRWLFSARADAWIREIARVNDAVEAARAGGHTIELYLSGFEALCDRELVRYNKGVTVDELVAAVEAMRARKKSDRHVFEYARARGHSLILWNPWTQVEDLRETIDHVRTHGLCELFTDLGKNRLRLYPDLPITYAAIRDAAIVEAWEDDDEGAARRKGYSVEQPWRFLDPRTRIAYALARKLRDRLGPETELPQLNAIVRSNVSDVDRVMRDLDALVGAMPEPPRGDRASAVLFAGACNNGCPTCPNRDRWLDDDLEARVDAARASSARAILLAGREPTIHPRFLELVKRARGEDDRSVGVVTNGRRFAYRSFAEASVGSGLRAASVKLFAPDAATADAIVRVPDAHVQALSGIAELRRAGLRAFEIRAPLNEKNLASFEDYADVAAQAEIGRIRLEIGLDALGLDRLSDAADAVRRLLARAHSLGITVSASPIVAGTRAFDALPS